MIIVAGLPLPVIVMFVLVGVFAVLLRFGIARNLVRRVTRGSTLDPREATKVAMLSPHGIEAAYVAASLQQPAASPAATSPAVAQPAAGTSPRSVGQRLDELIDLRSRNLITASEFQTRRQQIVESG